MLQGLLTMISSKKEPDELKVLLQECENIPRNTSVSAGLVLWHPDYQSACLAASRSKKPILTFQMSGNLTDRVCETSADYARRLLFSAPEIALFIMSNFEPCWQNVRRISSDRSAFEITWQNVPAVPTDFSKEESRTENSNGRIATIVCTADGVILDVLPGLYEPAEYLHQLEQFVLLNEMFETEGWHGVNRYHSEQSHVLNAGLPRKIFYKKQMNVLPTDCGEQMDESNPTEVLLFELPNASMKPSIVPSWQYLMPKGDELAEWERLTLMSSTNGLQRRIAIHDYLMSNQELAPHEITRWLLKNVF
jgi:hypothetical protein